MTEEGPAAYLRAARELRERSPAGLQVAKVAVLSTFTAEILQPYLAVESARRGIGADVYFGPYGQLEGQVLSGGSELYAFGPDVVFLATRLEDLAPTLVRGYATAAQSEVIAELRAVEERLSTLVAELRRRTEASIFVSNFPPLIGLEAGLAEASLAAPANWLIERANGMVAEICHRTVGAHVFDQHRLAIEVGLQRWSDPKLLFLGRIPLSATAQAALGRRMARYLRALFVPPCKCLVVDLDNVLWGGVIGEDGIGGIALGEDFPGNTYKEFQRALLSLRRAGTLLAIASKNEMTDVVQAFSHPDMVLRLDHFSAVKVDWTDKATNLGLIADELDIGLDALAFFDDSPIERAWVQARLPDVKVIDVPGSSAEYVRALEASELFDQLVISADDRRRAEMMTESAARRRLEEQSASLDDFLRGLGVRVLVGAVDDATFPRVVQLFAKTNQFNLTTRRHSAAHVRAMIEQGAVALQARVVDRFGDNGLTAVAIASPASGAVWRVDTFLMSCRVLGRKVETAVLAELVRRVRERAGSRLLGEYAATPRNSLVADFFPNHGFAPVPGSPSTWVLDLEHQDIAVPDHVRVESTDAARQ